MADKLILNAEIKVNTDRKQLNTELKKIQQSFRNVGSNTDIIYRARLDPNTNNVIVKATSGIKELQSVSQRTSSVLRALGAEIGGYFTRFTAFTLAASSVFSGLRFLSTATDEALEFDTALVKIGQTLGTTRQNLSSLREDVFSLSTNLGTSSKELINASLTLAQAGLSEADTRKALDTLARTTLAPSFKDTSNTIQGMIAVMNQFGLTVDDLEGKMDAINEVSKRYTVEAEDIISAVRIAGGVFSAAGDDLEEFISLFTAIKDTTQESSETIAQGLKTITARLQRPKTASILEALGFGNIRDAEGEFVGVFNALKIISQGRERLGLSTASQDFAQIVELLGGVRQFGKVIPAVLQFAKAEDVLRVATGSTNSLLRDQILAQDALTNSLTKTREVWLQLLVELSQNEGLRDLARLILNLASGLGQTLGYFQKLAPYLAILGTISAVKVAVPLIQGGVRQFSRFKGLNQGGWIPGEGYKDEVPAILTKGEYVLRKDAVKKIGKNTLDKINEGRIPFATGGLVNDFIRERELAEYSKNIIDNLTYDENYATFEYSGDLGSSEIHRLINTGQGSGRVKKFASILKRLTRKFQLPYDIFLFSGIGPTRLKQLLSSAKVDNVEDLVGKTVNLKSFLSTSTSIVTAKNFQEKGGSLLSIIANKGSTALPIYGVEREFLLPNGSSFDVLESKQSDILLELVKKPILRRKFASGGQVDIKELREAAQSYLSVARKELPIKNVKFGLKDLGDNVAELGQDIFGKPIINFTSKPKSEDDLLEALRHELVHLFDFTNARKLGLKSVYASGSLNTQVGRSSISVGNQLARLFASQGYINKYLTSPHEILAHSLQGITSPKELLKESISGNINTISQGITNLLSSGPDDLINQVLQPVRGRLQDIRQFLSDDQFNLMIRTQIEDSRDQIRRLNSRKFNYGGPVLPGYGSKDDVPALLTRGEYVLNKNAVKKIGVDTLDQINFGRVGYNEGGIVQGFQTGGQPRPLRGAALKSALDKLYREATESLDRRLFEDLGTLDVGDIEIGQRDLVQLEIPKSLIKKPLTEMAKQVRIEVEDMAKELEDLTNNVLLPSATRDELKPLSLGKEPKKSKPKSPRVPTVDEEAESLILSSVLPQLRTPGLNVGNLDVDSISNSVETVGQKLKEIEDSFSRLAPLPQPPRLPTVEEDVESLLLRNTLPQLPKPDRDPTLDLLDERRKKLEETQRSFSRLGEVQNRIPLESTFGITESRDVLRNRIQQEGLQEEAERLLSRTGLRPTFPVAQTQNVTSNLTPEQLQIEANRLRAKARRDFRTNLLGSPSVVNNADEIVELQEQNKRDVRARHRAGRIGGRSISDNAILNILGPSTAPLLTDRLSLRDTIEVGETQSSSRSRSEAEFLTSQRKKTAELLKQGVPYERALQDATKFASDEILKKAKGTSIIGTAFTKLGAAANKVTSTIGQSFTGALNRFRGSLTPRNIAGGAGLSALVLSQSELATQLFESVGGKRGGTAIQSTVGGALTGGFTAAAFGATGVGLGVGALVGAVAAVTASLHNLSKEIREARIESAIRDVVNRIKDIKPGKPTNIEAVTKEFTTLFQDINDDLKAELTTTFDPTQRIAAAGVGAAPLRLPGEPTTITQAKIPVTLVGQLSASDLKTLNEAVLDDTKVLETDNQAVKDFFETVKTARIAAAAPAAENVNAAIDKLIKTGEIRSLEDLDRIIPEWARIIELAKDGVADTIPVTRQEMAERLKLANSIRNFGEIITRASNAGLRLVNLANRIPNIENVTPLDPSSFLPTFRGLDQLGSVNFANGLRNLPLNERERTGALEINKAVAALPSALEGLSGKDFDDQFFKKLQSAGVDTDLSVALTGALNEFTQTDFSVFQQKMKDTANVMSVLSQAISAPVESIKTLASTLREFNSAQFKQFESVLGSRERVADASSNLDTSRTDLSRLRRGFRRLTPVEGRDRANFERDIFNRTGQRTVGGLVENIKLLDEARKNATDPTDQAKFAAASNQAVEALKRFTDTTNRTRDTQEKLNALEASRGAKLNLGERILNAEGPERREIFRDLSAARGFVESGADIKGFDLREQQRIIRGLRSFGSSIIEGTGKTGDVLADETLSKLFGITGSREDKDIASLQEKLIAAQKEAIQANQFLLDRENQIYNEFLNGITTENNSFLDRLSNILSIRNPVPTRDLGKLLPDSSLSSIPASVNSILKPTIPGSIPTGVLAQISNQVTTPEDVRQLKTKITNIEPGNQIPVIPGLAEFNTNFGANIQKLAETLSLIPSSIQIEAKHTVEVIFNGAQVFTSLQDSFKELAEKSIEQAINKMIREKFPDVGAFNR